MLQKKKIITAGVTFSVALGIGFFMQNSDVLAARSGTEVAQPTEPSTTTVEPQSQVAESMGPVLEAPIEEPQLVAVAAPETTVDIEAIEAPMLIAAIEPDPLTQPIPLVSSEPVQAPEPIAEVDCSPVMNAVSAPAAFATLELSAPCHVNAGVTIHHQGMMFSAVTDFDGNLSVDVPALAENAVFIAAFDTGDGAVAMHDFPELANFDRAVLQWQGEDSFAINAFEFGAGFGEDGHVSAASARDVAAIENGEGFLVQLGDKAAPQPLLAQVYTFPASNLAPDLDVVLSVDAQITSDNCEREISAQSIQILPGREVEALDLVMIMPACDSVGDYLVLKNMFQDLKLAAN